MAQDADVPRLYKARLLVTLPQLAAHTTVQVDLNLNVPCLKHSASADVSPTVIELSPNDIVFKSIVSNETTPLRPEAAFKVNGTSHAFQLPLHPPTLSSLANGASIGQGEKDSSANRSPLPSPLPPAIGQMNLPVRRSPAPSPSYQLPLPLPAPVASTSTSMPDYKDKHLPPVPTERLAAPLTRSTEDENIVRDFIQNSLKEAKQFSGTRPSPLTQIDRFLARVTLFCQLHFNTVAGDTKIPIYWSDLLKFGGMGTAWNEKKARRAYKHIYADLLQHQRHPLIVPLLEFERGKSLDDLENAFDTIYGRTHAAPTKTSLPSVSKKAAEDASEEPEEALLDLAENDQAAASSGPMTKKRKRECLTDPGPQPSMELLPIPSSRLSAPSSRMPEEENVVKQGIVNELVQTGQWSGTRPSVINSVSVLLLRIVTLIRLHRGEFVGFGEEKATVYWADCIKHGGISQAWASKKAGKLAFKTTYSGIMRHRDNPTIQSLLSAGNTDIKAMEAALAQMEAPSGGKESAVVTLAPLSGSTPTVAQTPGTGAVTPSGKRRGTPEWSASPEPLAYSEMLEGGLTPLDSSETTASKKAPSQSDEEVDELESQIEEDARVKMTDTPRKSSDGDVIPNSQDLNEDVAMSS